MSPGPRVLDQQAGQDRGQGAEALGPARLAVDDRAQRLELASAERWLALDREPQGGAQRPQVGGRADRLGLDLLGRHVGGRADHQAGRGQPGVALDRGDAEVSQLGGTVLADHDVLGLEVAVDDPGPVGGLERVQQAEPEPGGPLRGQRPAGADQLLQGRGRDQLHDDEVLTAVMGDVVDGDHPGVAEPGGRPGLPRHPRPQALPLGRPDPTGQVDLLERDCRRQVSLARQTTPFAVAESRELVAVAMRRPAPLVASLNATVRLGWPHPRDCFGAASGYDGSPVRQVRRRGRSRAALAARTGGQSLGRPTVGRNDYSTL